MHNRRTFLKFAGLSGVALPVAGIAFYSHNLISRAFAGSELSLLHGQYSTSWIGNSFAGKGQNGSGRWVQDEIVAMTVTDEGTVLTASLWDEAGRCTGLYRDNDTNVQCLMADGEVRSRAWGWGTAGTSVAVIGHLIFITNTAGDLLQFYWSDPHNIQSAIKYQGHSKSGLALAMAGRAETLALALKGGGIQIRNPQDMSVRNTLPLSDITGLAIDSKNSLWVIQKGQILHYGLDGQILPGRIGNVAKATAISIDKNDVMLICDNGPDQQVLSYTLSSKPQLNQRYGVQGGLRAGTPGKMAANKFFALRGAGLDAAGNLYVGMCFGPNPNSPVLIRSLNPQQQLRWELSKYAWVTAFCFDPRSDGTVIYGPESIFSYEPDQEPGKGWQAEAITLDAVRYPDDPRIMGKDACSTELRHLQGKRLLYTMGQTGGGYDLYAFEPAPSQIAHHVASLKGDGFAWNVDAEGGIWRGQTPDQNIWHYAFAAWSDAGIPRFKSPVKYPVPELFTRVTRAHYDSSSDSLYIGGYTANKGKKSWGLIGAVVARYDHWKSGKAQFRWAANMPEDGHGLPPKAFDIAGDYLFTIAVFPTAGKDAVVTIFRLDNGAKVGNISPGAAVGNQSGWADMIHAVHALRRKNGQYLIMVEEDARGKNIVYQWTPA
ncbi:hypothetical protein A6M27_05480 [Acidithiobacillus thiooxidans]|uniref:Uncharacterized protein n=8 Tax=Acidithiobacillus thiooxidans TaxID=930 RepID=A0A1C2JKR8_ACITH|nr:hypothetical protein [Acidithiobacillus thiooxidans]OCX72940.1 hypothetical protein A6M23_08745 [Acidithiobacillus thiooxidans]OCX73639.1 hypothetical protein A6P07_07775 [Acidithiobacillus thiooxidans]OCX88834.1 hypothetical protein A6M27_05480 [Acidithiobacillus thiooxidans]OFC46451.1 hypothetical protein BAE47_09700 [Acidithiobacillus thiooxidans]